MAAPLPRLDHRTSIRDLRLHQPRQQLQRFLPAEVAHFLSGSCPECRLLDRQLVPQDTGLNAMVTRISPGRFRVVELVGVHDAFVLDQLQVFRRRSCGNGRWRN